MKNERFLFCLGGHWNIYPQFPPLLRAADILSRKYGLEGHLLLAEMSSLPDLSQTRGIFSDGRPALAASSLTVHQIATDPNRRNSYRFEPAALKGLLHRLQPSYLYIHTEFWEEPSLQLLRYYRFKKTPRIIAYAAANHISGRRALFTITWPFISRTRLWQLLLWGRLNGVSACATPSLECARRLGLPPQVPVAVSYLPVFGPGEITAAGITLPWSTGEYFILGFAGLLSRQKGWRVLNQALELLPAAYKLLIAGDGPDRDGLMALLQTPSLRDRVFYAGLLPLETLLATLPALNVLVLPSITLPDLVEQFGAVLAEAMALGVPVIGSDSGAIPETIGEAGFIVPEGDPRALAQAIQKICSDKKLCLELGTKGVERYRRYYSCEAYAGSLARLFGLPDSPQSETMV
jgi:glycosyltransferase involved in cell wall biosynthesis